MKKQVFALMVFLLVATATTWAFAQDDYDGQNPGGDNGGCEAIKVPQDQLHQELPPPSATEVGGRAIMHDADGEPRGFSPAVEPTTKSQDELFLAFADKYGLLGRSDKKELEQLILSKDRAINKRVDKLGNRVGKVETKLDKVDKNLEEAKTKLNKNIEETNNLRGTVNKHGRQLEELSGLLNKGVSAMEKSLSISVLALIFSLIAICVSCLAIIKKGYYWIACKFKRREPPTL